MQIINWIFLFGILSAILFSDKKKRIYITTIAIFFPFHMWLGGFYLMSTGTVSILLTYILSFMPDKKARPTDNNYSILIIFLICIGLIAMFSSLKVVDKGDAIRKYVQFCSVLLLFLSVCKLPFADMTERFQFIEKLFALIIILISSHILISLIILFSPTFESYLRIFYQTPEGALKIEFERIGLSSIARMRSFVFHQESYGEILATICPMVIYKVLVRKKPLYTLFFIIFAVGVALSITRSGIILFCLSGTAAVIVLSPNNKLAFAFFLFFGIGSLIMLLWQKSTIIDHALLRFGLEAADSFAPKTQFLKKLYPFFLKINRGFWVDVIQTYVLKPSLFGNGFISPYNFHSLIFTIIFQIGIIGAIAYLALLMKIFSGLIRKILKKTTQDKSFVFVCAVSYITLLVNELKYEFTRHQSYYQICFLILGVFALIGSRYESWQLQAKESSLPLNRPLVFPET